MKVSLITIAVLVSTFSAVECWIWGTSWLWGSADSNSKSRAVQFVGDIPVANVPYEAKTDDEKFLEAAKQYTDLQLSDLDTCQHKIVLQIRTSCSGMSEDDLAKMSVNLLNCQAAVEGRRQFPCTAQMTLKDCTSAMDADMWNAYHLISNRARAVCYTARQQQFRAQTDIAVNRLMQSASNQLSTMEKLKEEQQKLGSFATDTFQSLATGQESLILQQERMRITQQNLKDFVGLNLRELTKEKALIAAGHKELAKLTEDIKSRLDAANLQLSQQSSQQTNNHEQLVADLELIRKQAEVIWDEIEISTQKILSHHELAFAKYEDTLEKLTKINTTVNYLLNLMETMRNELNERLGWLNDLVGAAGIYAILMHILYLLMGMIATAYVHASAFTRVCLLGIVPLNLAVLYHHGSDSALDFISMSFIILVSSAVYRFTMNLLQYNDFRKVSKNSSQYMKAMNGKMQSSNDIQYQLSTWWKLCKNKIAEYIDHMKNMSSEKSCISPEHHTEYFSDNYNPDSDDDNSYQDSERSSSIQPLLHNRGLHYPEHSFQPLLRSSVTPVRRVLDPQRNYSSPPTPPRSSTSSHATNRTPSRPATPRPLCIATCRNGLLCRNNAISGIDFCHIHHHESSKLL